MKKTKIDIRCSSCTKSFHSKCADISFECFSKSTDWLCTKCIDKSLPFSGLNDFDLLLTSQGKDLSNCPDLSTVPSFSMKCLLDKIPGQISIRTDELLSNNISSKYYTPNEFLTSRIPKNSFSVFHLNIASIEAHFDDLKTLLSCLDHSFDVIGISESKILENSDAIVNLNLEGYFMEQTKTKTFFGGTQLFIQEKYKDNYKLKNEYCKSVQGVAESVFIELNSEFRKNVVIGCIYRHHSNLDSFHRLFFDDLLHEIDSNEKNKTVILMGDFNIDLLKIEDNNIAKFYDQLSSFGFRPLILQPTRITGSSATLIDNIFTNNIETESIGGNLTTSISDHFSQFSFIDVFGKIKIKKPHKYGRSYKNFNNDEFQNELRNIDWDTLLNGKNSNDSLEIFYKTIEKLLDEMAPVKKLSKKEANLKMRPWITINILKDMNERDSILKQCSKEKDVTVKETLFKLYQSKRNKVISDIRNSKGDYYHNFFLKINLILRRHGKVSKI